MARTYPGATRNQRPPAGTMLDVTRAASVGCTLYMPLTDGAGTRPQD